MKRPETVAEKADDKSAAKAVNIGMYGHKI